MPHWSFTTIKHAGRIKLDLSLNEYCVLDYIYRTQTHPRYGKDGWCQTGLRTMSKFLGLGLATLSDIQKRMIEKELLDVREEPAKVFRKTTPKFYDIAYLEDVEIENLPDPSTAEGVRNPNTPEDESVRNPNAGVRIPNANRSEPEQINKVFNPLTEIEGEPDFSTPKDTSPRAGSDPESDKSHLNNRELYDSKEFLEYDHALRKLLQKVDKKLRACILDSDVGREDFLDTFVKWCFDSGKTFTGISGLDKLLESHVGFLKSGGKEILEPDMREFEAKIEKVIQFAISRWLVTDPYGNSYKAFLAMNDMNYHSEADALKTLLTRRKINFEDLRIVLAYTGRWRDGKNIYTPNFKYSWAAYLQSPDSLKQDVEYLKEMEDFFQNNRQKVLA